nr:hypothetical protein GCM10020093_089280 [Planobispora longispora]
MWSGWPATEYVSARGLDHLDDAMATLGTLTPYATGEFAVRPYLERYRDDAMKIMYGWAESPTSTCGGWPRRGPGPGCPGGRGCGG